MFEDPLARNDIRSWWTVDKAPSAIALERVELLGHCGTPVGVFESSTNQARNWGDGGGAGHESVAGIGFVDASFGACHHWMGTGRSFAGGAAAIGGDLGTAAPGEGLDGELVCGGDGGVGWCCVG